MLLWVSNSRVHPKNPTPNHWNFQFLAMLPKYSHLFSFDARILSHFPPWNGNLFSVKKFTRIFAWLQRLPEAAFDRSPHFKYRAIPCGNFAVSHRIVSPTPILARNFGRVCPRVLLQNGFRGRKCLCSRVMENYTLVTHVTLCFFHRIINSAAN